MKSLFQNSNSLPVHYHVFRQQPFGLYLKKSGIITLLLLFFAVTAGLSQNSILNKKITINQSGLSLEDALMALGDQAGCTFSYSSSLIETNKKVDLHYDNIPLIKILEDILGETAKGVQVQNNGTGIPQITIKPIRKTGSIKGNVKDPEGKVAEFVNVRIKETGKGSVTDAEGNFILKDIPDGNYTLLVSFLGLATQSRQAVISADQVLTMDFTLLPDHTLLQQVEVTGRKENSYKSDYSFSATKVQMAVKDISQTVSTITKELIQDRQAFKLNDVVQNIAGVNQFSVYDDITIRGFRSARDTGRLLNGMRVSNNWLSPMLTNIERVEVIKGPASATFANTNPGGTVNMITKKPLDKSRQSINFTVGSYNTIRTQADFTGPLDSAKTLLYRINIGYENAESFVNNIFNKNLIVAPSISFLPKKGTRFNVDLVYGDVNTILDRGRPTFQNDNSLFSTPLNFNMNQPGDFLKDKTLSVTFSYSQQLARNMTVNAAFMMSKFNELQNEHGLTDYITRDSVSMDFYDRQIKINSQSLNLYFNNLFSTGQLQHNLLYGYDYNSRNDYFYVKAAIGEADGVANFSLKNPEYFNRPISSYIYQKSNGWTESSESATHGIYIQDVIKFSRFQLLLSLRQEFYKIPASNFTYDPALEQKTQKQNALLPRVGITYALTRDINVYGTYSTGFEPQYSGYLASPSYGGPFDPLTSELLEAGSKGEFFNKRLFAGLSVYRITQNNVLVSANDTGNPDLLRQRGQEQAKGIEAEATGRILPNLSVSLNYAYNVAKIKKESQEELVGRIKENAPKNLSGSWIKYVIDKGPAKGLGISFGHSQVSARNTFETDLVLPAYLILNGGISYKVDRFRLSANVYNITDKSYFSSGYSYDRNWPGAPRNILVNVGYTF